jgi:hypothetical protein
LLFKGNDYSVLKVSIQGRPLFSGTEAETVCAECTADMLLEHRQVFAALPKPSITDIL